VRRLRLKPRIDVEKIAASLGELSEKRFPIEIDGLCLDLKVPGKRPKIWISKSISDVRRRFTLAHEIGHIIIPWHIGSIVDNIDVPVRIKGQYQFMEAEANRFAAELLMPSEWVRSVSERSEHITGLLTTLQRVGDVSFKAALYRTLQYGQPGYIAAKVIDGVIIQTRKTRGTMSYAPGNGEILDSVEMPTAEDPVTTSHREVDYVWWKVDNRIQPNTRPGSTWRDILTEILQSVYHADRQRILTKVNAIVGNAIGRLPHGSSVADLYSRAVAVTSNRNDVDGSVMHVLRHPLFNEYLLARCFERSELVP